MPIRYAIRSERKVPLTAAESAQLKTQGYSAPEMKCSYEDVPPVVADVDEENGMYALFSESGVKLSKWMTVKKPEEVEQALMLGRRKPGSPLKDSIGQEISQGDYVFTHSHDHRNLELSQVVRNMSAKMVVEQLANTPYWSGSSALRTRNPHSFIKVPTEVIEGGVVIPEKWEKRFSIDIGTKQSRVYREEHFVPIDKTTARQDTAGHFCFYDSKNAPVTGWISIIPDNNYDAELLARKVHAGKKLVEELPVPLTDAMGTDILLGDIVFSNDNHTNDFMLCEVIGFTKERVRLVAYESAGVAGYRIITLNWPKNILKLPINIINA